MSVEPNRWLRPKPPREQRVCRHSCMQAVEVEHEQHFLFSAFIQQPGCLMSHNWLHTPDCKVLNEMLDASVA